MGGKRKTQEEFLNEASAVHGNTYDYSLVNYSGSINKVSIVCEHHGVFNTTPSAHIRGRGCPRCQLENRKKTTKQFIKESIEKYGDRFDYSNVNYINAKTSVEIICKKHGLFHTNPSNHLNGKFGCKKCYNESITDTIDDFINKSKLVHGNIYDYSLVEFKNCNTKVYIICGKHGVFSQLPSSHLAGHGCSSCGNDRLIATISKSTEDFIRDSKLVHGDTYDYSKVNYTRSCDYVSLICPTHGEFTISAGHHLRGQGCNRCHIENITIPLDERINVSREIHGDKYDYSLINPDTYDGGNNKSKIICPDHGVFEQRMNSHVKGHGCPKCASSNVNNYFMGVSPLSEEDAKKPAIIYHVRFTRHDGKVFDKIGITTRGIKCRFKGVKKSEYQCRMLRSFEGSLGDCVELEQLILDELKDSDRLYRVHDFKDTTTAGWTECFYPTESDKLAFN